MNLTTHGEILKQNYSPSKKKYLEKPNPLLNPADQEIFQSDSKNSKDQNDHKTFNAIVSPGHTEKVFSVTSPTIGNDLTVEGPRDTASVGTANLKIDHQPLVLRGPEHPSIETTSVLSPILVQEISEILNNIGKSDNGKLDVITTNCLQLTESDLALHHASEEPKPCSNVVSTLDPDLGTPDLALHHTDENKEINKNVKSHPDMEVETISHILDQKLSEKSARPQSHSPSSPLSPSAYALKVVTQSEECCHQDIRKKNILNQISFSHRIKI